MKMFWRALLAGITLFVVAGHADIVLVGTVYFYDTAFIKDIPFRFYVSGHAGDTALDKIAYTDSTGRWSITFHGMSSASFNWVNAMGTGAQINGTKASDMLPVSLPQITGSHPAGRGDTCEISMDNFSNYQEVSLGFLVKDSIVIAGTIEDGGTENPIQNKPVTVTFHNYAFNKDTVLSTTTDFGGTFQFPTFFNNGCFIAGRISASATGYVDLDTLCAVTGTVWNGKTDSIMGTFKMYNHAPVKDTLDTLLVTGSVLRQVNSAPLPKAVATIAMAFWPDSLTFSRTYPETTATDGSFSLRLRDTTSTRAKKIYLKLQASAANYTSSAVYPGIVTMSDPASRGGKLITYGFLPIKLDSLLSSVEYIVASGTVKDSAGTRALGGIPVKVSLGSDTSSYPIVLAGTTDTGGRYTLITPNSSGVSHVFYKVEAATPGYLYGFLRKDTTIVAGDGKSDTILAGMLGLRVDHAVGDTLVIMGTITDSISGNPNRPVKSAIVAIHLGADTSGLSNGQVFGPCTTSASGSFVFKLQNTVLLNHVYGRIIISDAGYGPGIQSNDCVIVSNDRKNDTLTMNCKLQAITSARLASAIRLLPMTRTPVRVFDLRGRLIYSFVYESYEEAPREILARSSKFLGNLAQDVCIVVIGNKNATTFKFIPGLTGSKH